MSLKTLSAVLLVVVALGVVVQSFDDPEVPLGSSVIFLVAAAITGFVRSRWAAIAAVVACVFFFAVTIGIGSVEYLVVVLAPFQTVGLWIQTIAGILALICAISVLFRREKAGAVQVETAHVVEDS